MTYRAVRCRSRIVISELRLPARVGVNPGEQGAEQPVLADIWLETEDPERPDRSEQLADTVDYVTVARTVRKVVARRHYPLVETLAAEVARAVLGLAGVTRVGIKLQKLACMRRASSAGVEVEMERAESAPRPAPSDAQQVGAGPVDIAVIGGGAAGLSAALWCWRLGHPALLVDSSARLGGQLHLVHGAMPDIPGLPPIPGVALVERLERQFMGHEGRWLRARLQGLTAQGAQWRLVLAPQGDGAGQPVGIKARAAIIATGSRRRALGVPGERELLGRGLLYTAARGAEQQAGRHVLVVGGGDSACENALLLQQAGARITLVHRGAQLTAREQFAAAVGDNTQIQVIPDSSVVRFLGDQALRGALLAGATGEHELVADAALVRIGWQPNSEALPSEWLDSAGFVRRQGETQVAGAPGMFVTGEVGGPISSSVAAAFGGGAAAAMSAVRFLERG